MVPGLAAAFPGVADDAFAPAPALSKWLGRARPAPFGARAPEHALLGLFEVDGEAAAAPLAPFCYLHDAGHPPARFCWRLDPVHLRAEPHGLILFDAASCRLGAAERQRLLATLRAFLAEQGWTLEAPAGRRWYLFGPAREIDTLPLSAVRGRSVAERLPRGADAPAWLKLSNEMQMLLHTHPVNTERAARGLPAINSVWLSGGGVLPANAARRPFDAVYADDPLAGGLAAWAGAAAAAVPDGARALLEQRRGAQRLLVLLDGCLPAADHGDLGRWNECLRVYERNWFAPLLEALSSRNLRSLELLPLNGRRYRLGKRDLWRFWRASRPYRASLAA